MRLFSNSVNSFPHPVLGMPGFEFNPEAPRPVKVVPHIPLKERINEPYSWDFFIELGNVELERMIEEKKATYVCEVKCSATFLRFCEKSYDNKITVSLNRHCVQGRIEFALWVVAEQDIPEYRNSAADEDYKELEPFEISKGAPLAFLYAFYWDSDLCYEDLTSLRSILKLKENSDPNCEFPSVDADAPYITLFLPSGQYRRFLEIAQSESINAVLHSSLLLFALQSALVQYSPQKDRRWQRAIERMVRHDAARYEGLELGVPEQADQIAVRLLNNPTFRLSETIADLAAAALSSHEDSNDDEDEEGGAQ